MEDVSIKEKVSIIFVHWAMNGERSETMRQSLNSLCDTARNAEIIVVDNGESIEDSRFLLTFVHEGRVACYVRNRHNMHFGYARNQGLKLGDGEFVGITDNDILFSFGWLEDCVAFLKRNPGKYLATPLEPDPMNRRRIRQLGELDGWRLNERAGSNCWIMRREDYEAIGDFDIHRIAGSKWTDRYRRLHYAMACAPTPMAKDLGFRKGYNFNESVKNLEL